MNAPLFKIYNLPLFVLCTLLNLIPAFSIVLSLVNTYQWNENSNAKGIKQKSIFRLGKTKFKNVCVCVDLLKFEQRIIMF